MSFSEDINMIMNTIRLCNKKYEDGPSSVEEFKNELKEIINSFCKELKKFSDMYFNDWINNILEEDFAMSYYIENWCKNAKLENIDALFRNLGINFKFQPGDYEQEFLYDCSYDYHAKNALVINLEDISDSNTMYKYLSYIKEYTIRFYECIVKINQIPNTITRYPADYSISLEVIDIKDNMKKIVDYFTKLSE